MDSKFPTVVSTLLSFMSIFIKVQAMATTKSDQINYYSPPPPAECEYPCLPSSPPPPPSTDVNCPPPPSLPSPPSGWGYYPPPYNPGPGFYPPPTGNFPFPPPFINLPAPPPPNPILPYFPFYYKHPPGSLAPETTPTGSLLVVALHSIILLAAFMF